MRHKIIFLYHSTSNIPSMLFQLCVGTKEICSHIMSCNYKDLRVVIHLKKFNGGVQFVCPFRLDIFVNS